MRMTRFLSGALTTVLATGLVGSSRAQTRLAPNYAKPLFTLRGTPLCQSRDDLETLLSVVRSGQRELVDMVQGCTTFPVEGIPVVVLERQGIIDVWLRVRLMISNDTQPTVWTVGWLLRNDDSPAITGDPTAGKIRVCITKGQPEAHIPALSMFKNAGSLVGDLQDEWSKERYRPKTYNDHAALVTTEAADLTKAQPCDEVHARMFVRDEFTVKTWAATPDIVWDFDHVLGYTVRRLSQPGGLDWLRGQIGLRASVLADIGDPLSTTEDEAAKGEPENPLNRIPADLKLAQAAPLSGPNGKGNFKVCLSRDIDDVPDREAQPVTVPSNVIFESAGRLIGDLRDPEPDVHHAMYDSKTSWSVITQKSFTVSKKHPCATVSVRTVLSNSGTWLFPLVRELDHLRFQALKLKGYVGTRLPGHFGDALDGGALNGVAVADIGRPLDLGNEMP